MGDRTPDELDEEIKQKAEDNIVLGGLIGKDMVECVVCKGDGTFDRLWPGNTEQCYYCGGTGWCFKDGERRSRSTVSSGPK